MKNSKYLFDLKKIISPRRKESPTCCKQQSSRLFLFPQQQLTAPFWTLAIIFAGALVSPLHYNCTKGSGRWSSTILSNFL